MPKFDLVKQIFTAGADKIVSSVGNALDDNLTNQEEKMAIKKDIQDKILDTFSDLSTMATNALLAELNGNWLQRSWRPIIMLAFAAIVVYNYFVAYLFGLPTVTLEKDFWNLLEIGLGGYVIGRSAEKIVGTVTDKIDIVPSRVKRNSKNDSK